MGKNRTTLRWDRQKATVVAYLTSGPEAMGGEREREHTSPKIVFFGGGSSEESRWLLAGYLELFDGLQSISSSEKKNESLVEG